MKATKSLTKAPSVEAHESWAEAVRRQVGSLRFGSVEIVVHNGRVVQIEKSEKIRFEHSEDP